MNSDIYIFHFTSSVLWIPNSMVCPIYCYPLRKNKVPVINYRDGGGGGGLQNRNILAPPYNRLNLLAHPVPPFLKG